MELQRPTLFSDPPSYSVLLFYLKTKKKKSEHFSSGKSDREGGFSLIWNRDLKKEKEEEGGEEGV